ncbi:MAG TPA: glycerophosphodiester phosphodiesterase family protein [Myxococcales bacterium]|nr:glycerophosphodiester phosphodiesterase family protein [Myxococcales bacterium]
MLPAHFSRDGRPLIWAHRGASAEAPENTLAAFALALRQGADGVELDAQRCATGEVVVVHDDSLARTAGHPGLVTATPWSTVRGLDAGGWKGAAFRGERVPLLAEVLESFPRLVNVELKCDRADDRGLTAEVVRVVRGAKAEDRVLLSSFNPLCLARARLLAPGLPRAMLFERQQSWPLRSALAAPLVGARALHPERVLATPSRIARWRRRGYSVACWTVDDPEEAGRLHLGGVSGIITNRPEAMRAKWKR